MKLTKLSKSLDESSSRRKLLKGVAASTGFSGLVGVGKAQEQTDALDFDQYIVGTKSSDGTNAARIRAHFVNHILQLGSDKQAVAGRFSKQVIEFLEQHPDVRYIERDGTYWGGSQTLSWGVDRINANRTIDAGFTGSEAHIAVIDTGIDKDHPDLQANLGTGKSFVPETDSWDDDMGHGTHCAGIAAASDNSQGVVGTAPAVKLHAGKVLNSDNWGQWSWIAAGIEWAADQGYDVANISVTGDAYSQTVSDACKYAYDKGVLLVACAGNGHHGPVAFPAAYSEVIAVSSTTKSDTLSEFSNVGLGVELAAPGSEIYSTLPGGYGYKSGTSMACPHVSGVAGLLMSSEGGNLSHEQARQHLRTTAEDIGLSEDKQGFGLVDAEAAMETPIDEVDQVSNNQSDLTTRLSSTSPSSTSQMPDNRPAATSQISDRPAVTSQMPDNRPAATPQMPYDRPTATSQTSDRPATTANQEKTTSKSTTTRPGQPGFEFLTALGGLASVGFYLLAQREDDDN